MPEPNAGTCFFIRQLPGHSLPVWPDRSAWVLGFCVWNLCVDNPGPVVLNQKNPPIRFAAKDWFPDRDDEQAVAEIRQKKSPVHCG